MVGPPLQLCWRWVGGEVVIVVIADDITGAAELAGIGLRYDLRVVVAADVAVSSSTDLLVLYSNTRSMAEGEAVNVMASLTEKAQGLKPSLFYKKIDSVLRGHVVAETKAQMKLFGCEQALLVPVNPLLGRTISDGRYYLNGKPIHESSFSFDPEFPIVSSDVKEMVGNKDVEVVKKGDQLTKGISIGEAGTMHDVDPWADYQSKDVLLGGAASFFLALLESNYNRVVIEKKPNLSSPMLLVSGTTYQKSIEQRKIFGHLVIDMPSSLYSTLSIEKNGVEAWANDIIAVLSKYKKAIIAIGEHDDKGDSNLLREKISEVVKLVFQRTPIFELLLEGGSTAFSIIQKLGFSSFIPIEELQQGVVRMKVVGKEDLHLTIKPGSYDWPAEWNFN
jgi:uncharacterized protein YgbK (DUF1537 family)